MFSEKMNRAVNTAQKVTDRCCSAENIAVTANSDLAEFAALLESIDPSGTDLDGRSLLARVKISRYRRRLGEVCPKIEELTGRLTHDRKVLSNTVKTLTREKNCYDTVFEEYRKELSESGADNEQAGQFAVARNMSDILANMLNEYTALRDSTEAVLNISKQTAEIAAVTARTKFRAASAADTEYRNKMSELIRKVKALLQKT